ncbi:hypothetical protein Dimus_010256, partial [Dionaea muscipula]
MEEKEELGDVPPPTSSPIMNEEYGRDIQSDLNRIYLLLSAASIQSEVGSELRFS